MAQSLQWYDENADNMPWIKALAELRRRATREGYCYQHVQAITVAINQYAEKALGNRDYFSQQALWHWWWQKRSRPLIVRDSKLTKPIRGHTAITSEGLLRASS